MTDSTDYGRRCPRCGRLSPIGGLVAGSRCSKDRDTAICILCGELEAVRDWHELPPIPFDEWPVNPAELGREFALLTDAGQRGEFRMIDIGDLQ